MARKGLEEQQEDRLSAAALSVCEDGVFASPSRLPPPTRQQVALRRDTSGASYASRHPERPVAGEEGQEGRGSAGVVPAPLWPERIGREEDKAVVLAADRKGFAHFWLVNVEKKLLVVAIPKVKEASALHTLRSGGCRCR